jgi:hypothetical protein
MLIVKILSFSICFAMICVLNEISVEIGKEFVGAGGGVNRPCKSVFKGGPGRHLSLKGRVTPRPTPTNPFPIKTVT